MLCFVFIEFLVTTVHIKKLSYFIRYRCQCYKKIDQKEEERKISFKKKRERSEKNLKDLCCGVLLKILVYIFELVVILLAATSYLWAHQTTRLAVPQPSLLATYSSTKNLNQDVRFVILTTSLPSPLKLPHQHCHGPWEQERTWVSKRWDRVFPQIILYSTFSCCP